LVFITKYLVVNKLSIQIVLVDGAYLTWVSMSSKNMVLREFKKNLKSFLLVEQKL
jgi:hypothetical protein